MPRFLCRFVALSSLISMQICCIEFSWRSWYRAPTTYLHNTRFGDAHFRSLAQALPNQLGRKREQEKINVTLLWCLHQYVAINTQVRESLNQFLESFKQFAPTWCVHHVHVDATMDRRVGCAAILSTGLSMHATRRGEPFGRSGPFWWSRARGASPLSCAWVWFRVDGDVELC